LVGSTLKITRMITISGTQLYLWRQKAIALATVSGIPPKEIDWLLRETTDLDSLSLRLESFKQRESISSQKSLSDLESLWQLRLEKRLPLQYLLGVAHWRNFSLVVSPDVLIPRPETEILIDIALDAIGPGCARGANAASPNQELSSGNWVDLGTGSGAIALGLAEVLPQAKIYAVDYSENALAIAKTNAATLGFTERIEFTQGWWWSPLARLQGQVAGMVSNPPYIPSFLVGQLQPEVSYHEPHLALDGGEDGLDHIRYLVKTAPDYLQSGGVWLIEAMIGQTEAITQILQQQGSYEKIKFLPDLAGIDRFVLAYRL
jgi:release factor glutamine methyltransferase